MLSQITVLADEYSEQHLIAWMRLDATLLRVTTPDVPLFHTAAELNTCTLSVEKIVAAIERTLYHQVHLWEHRPEASAKWPLRRFQLQDGAAALEDWLGQYTIVKPGSGFFMC